MTGTTVSWAIHTVLLSGAFWAPPTSLNNLPLAWGATVILGILFAAFRKLSALAAAALSTWGGTTLGLAHFAALLFMHQPKMVGVDYGGSFAMMAVVHGVTVAFSGVLWLPAVWLSWNRHQNRARDLQKAFSHA